MTRGLYEQIGAQSDADLDEIKAAYGRAVAHVLRRREATIAQGGDTAALDLMRAQLDEAWTVLSDPARRRRYDAMLAVAGDGLADTDLDDLWTQVAGAMIHPAVAAAARIVDAATTLELGPLPEPPRPTPGRRAANETIIEDAPLPMPSPSRVVPSFGAPRAVAAAGSDVVPLHGEGGPGLRVVRPRETPAAVVELAHPPTTPTVVPPPASTADVDQLVDELGYSGALLKSLREARGLSITELSETTRISARYLEAVEDEDFGALPPAPAFVRGYVREMSRMLGLDVERVVSGYMRRFSADG